LLGRNYMNDDDRRCTGLRRDGGRCRAPRLPGQDRCVFHSDDPSMAARRAAGRRQGGLARSTPTKALPESEPDLPLNSAEEVATLLGRACNEVRKGVIDPRVANAVGQLAGTLLRALESSAVEARMTDIERRLDALAQAARLPYLPTNFNVKAIPCRPSDG
jgi:hypothetical protein